MSWTMPHRVVQVVAALIVVAALSSFTLGVLNAPQRGRLPGEKPAAGGQNTSPPVEAAEATPLSQERIEGPPPPPPEAENKVAEADNETAPATNAAPPPADDASVGDAGNATALAPPVTSNMIGNVQAVPEEPPH